MKNNIFTLFLLLLFITGLFSPKESFGQNSRFEYRGRFTPSIKKEKLNEARFISEIMPEFRHYVDPYNERVQLDQLLKLTDTPQENYIYFQKSFYHQENYEKIIDYVSIEISATCNGKTLTSQSKRNALTAEQKNILNTADLGSDISIKIKFKYKYETSEFPDSESKIREVGYVVTLVPEIEAEYPGGNKQLSEYLTQHVFNKIFEPYRSSRQVRGSDNVYRAIVKFTVNQEGQITDPKITRTSTDPKIDKLILDAIHKMPKWRPAKNAKGINVKQEFSIPFGGGGC